MNIPTATIRRTVIEEPSNTKMPAKSRYLAIEGASGVPLRFSRGSLELPKGERVTAKMAAQVRTGGRLERRADAIDAVATGDETDTVELRLHCGANTWHVRIHGLREVRREG